jgi:hypothetical protein
VRGLPVGGCSSESADRHRDDKHDRQARNAGPLNRARVLAEQAGHLITRGEPGQARRLLDQALQLFTAAGSEPEAAATQAASRAWADLEDVVLQ